MGEQARQQVIQCKQAFARRDVELAQDLVRQDDVIDQPQPRRASAARSRSATTPDRREWAMHDDAGRARCIERIGDNAVDIGEQVAFVVTGLFREFEDASHPRARHRQLFDLRLHRHRQQHDPPAGGGCR